MAHSKMPQHACVMKSLFGTYRLYICMLGVCKNHSLQSSRLSIAKNAAGNLHQGVAIIIHLIVTCAGALLNHSSKVQAIAVRVLRMRLKSSVKHSAVYLLCAVCLWTTKSFVQPGFRGRLCNMM